MFISFITYCSYGQTYFNLARELKVDGYALNSKYQDGKKDPMLSNPNKSTVTKSLSGDLFKEVTLYYDELDELTQVIYNVRNEKDFRKKSGDLLSMITKDYGNPKIETDSWGISAVWKSDTIGVKLYIETKSLLGSSLSVFSRSNNYKVVKKYDEFEQTTSLRPIDYRIWLSDGELEYGVEFIGYKESKNIFMTIKSQSQEWKFIDYVQILTEGGRVVKKDLKSKREVIKDYLGDVQTFEVGVTELNSEDINAILKSPKTKFRIHGNRTGDVELSNSHVKALAALVDAINK